MFSGNWRTGALRAAGLATVFSVVMSLGPVGASAAPARGGAYTSDLYGFTVSWDAEVWTGEPVDSSETSQGISLESELSFANFQGLIGNDQNPEQCLTELRDMILADSPTAQDVKVAPRKMERPNVVGGGAGELYTYTFSSDSAELDMAIYFECDPLAQEDRVFHTILMSSEADYDTAVAEWNELTASVELPGGQGSSTTSNETELPHIGAGVDKGSASKGKKSNSAASYQNDDLGYSISWDEDLFSVEEKNDDDAGFGVELQSDRTYAYIVGLPIAVTPSDCVDVLTENIEKTFENTKVAPKRYDRPATDRAAEGELYTFLSTDGETKMIGYIECREVAGGDGILSVQLSTEVGSYEDEFPVWEDLLGGIEVGDATGNGGQEEEQSQEEENTNEEGSETEGTAYAFQDFGFGIVVDESVWSVEDASDADMASLNFDSEYGTGYILAVASGADAQSCVDTLAGGQADREGVSGFDVAPRKMARPETDRSATGELFTYTFEGSSGPIDVVNYIECRPLADGETILVFSFTTAEVLYEDAVPAVEQLIAGIELAG